MTRNPRIAFALVLILYVTVAYCYDLIIPYWIDEIWSLIPTWNLIHNGFLGMGIEPSLIRPTIHGETHLYWFPPLYFVSLAGWFKVWGYGLMSARWHTIAWGCALLVGVYWIGAKTNHLSQHPHVCRKIYPAFAWTGIYAALITALNYNFLPSSDARPDMMCAALGIWAIATRSAWFAAAACLCHPFGWFYPIVLACIKRKVEWVPYAVAMGLWGIYIAQAPSIALEQWWGQLYAHFALAGTAKGCAVYIATGAGWRLLLLATFVGCAAVTALRYRDIAWCLALLVMPAFFLTSSCFYFVHAVPWLALCAAIQGRKHPWCIITILLLECIFAVTTLIPLWNWNGLGDLG